MSFIFIFFIVICILAVPVRANAYIDPGAGSYIFQVLVAVFIGALFSFRLWWLRGKRAVLYFFKKREKHADTTNHQPPA